MRKKPFARYFVFFVLFMLLFSIIFVGVASGQTIEEAAKAIEAAEAEEEEEEVEMEEYGYPGVSLPPQQVMQYPTVTPEQPCDGCKSDSRCIPYGAKFATTAQIGPSVIPINVVCTFGGLVPVKEKGEFCNYNYECKSNFCVKNTCSTFGGVIASWFKKIFSFLFPKKKETTYEIAPGVGGEIPTEEVEAGQLLSNIDCEIGGNFYVCFNNQADKTIKIGDISFIFRGTHITSALRGCQANTIAPKGSVCCATAQGNVPVLEKNRIYTRFPDGEQISMVVTCSAGG